MSYIKRFACVIAVLVATAGYGDGEVVVEVDPHISQSISGQLELERNKYFNLGHGGSFFAAKVGDPERVDTYLNTYNMSFGRSLGLIKTHVVWQPKVFEDPERKGFVDIERLEKLLAKDYGASAAFKERFAPNLDVANHEFPNAYPEFMQQFFSAEHPGERLPSNGEAAAELVATVLAHGYDDWSRPATYEPINEPHWSLWGDQRLADLHLAIHDKVRAEKIPTLVGGPCMAIPYFYKKDYAHLKVFSSFIDHTNAELDFYSFHSYDFLAWDAERGDFRGRVSSGLPLEGVLDAISNYSVNAYGKEVDLVLSEHGGYLFRDEGNIATAELAEQLIGAGSGFAWEMKRRSIGASLMVGSAIANTMTFMNHPHIIRKAVPFILLESFDWNPRYYASLLVADQFSDQSAWRESELVYFYALFADVQGRRVRAVVDDPDIQHHAFVEGDVLYIALNNLADKKERLDLRIADSSFAEIEIKRFGRNADFTPYFARATLGDLAALELGGREAIVLALKYGADITEQRRVDEKIYYGDKVATAIAGVESFAVEVPEYKEVSEAVLRIGVGRPAGTDRDITVVFNGAVVEVAMEDAADYLESGEYGSSKFIRLDKALLKKENVAEISFADGKGGGIGALVIRAVVE